MLKSPCHLLSLSRTPIADMYLIVVAPREDLVAFVTFESNSVFLFIVDISLLHRFEMNLAVGTDHSFSRFFGPGTRWQLTRFLMKGICASYKQRRSVGTSLPKSRSTSQASGLQRGAKLVSRDHEYSPKQECVENFGNHDDPGQRPSALDARERWYRMLLRQLPNAFLLIHGSSPKISPA